MLHIELRASFTKTIIDIGFEVNIHSAFCIWLYHNFKIEIYRISKCLQLGGVCC